MTAATRARAIAEGSPEIPKRFSKACRSTRRQSEIALWLGELEVAERFAREAIEFADEASTQGEDEATQQIINTRRALAHVLFVRGDVDKGDVDEASRLFAETEELLLRPDPWQTRVREMHMIYRFVHAELLLEKAQTKRAEELVESVSSSNPGNLLLIALIRAFKGKLILSKGISNLEKKRAAEEYFTEAVDRFRAAGQDPHTVRGFLFRAEFWADVGDVDGAISDLDEAWEIAERGPMPLFMADIHLSRARLFGNRKANTGNWKEEETCYPWESPEHDLVEARRLIFKHGYLRRKEELEDAEAARLNPSSSAR
jgi:tetratricopeptide (TPR) repeat protein